MTFFDKPLDAMSEMRFLVRETRLTHRLFKNKKGKYFVSASGYTPTSKTMLLAELNCRAFH
jgi:hypothetical protein